MGLTMVPIVVSIYIVGPGREAVSVTFIVVRNGICNWNSNPGRGGSPFTPR